MNFKIDYYLLAQNYKRKSYENDLRRRIQFGEIEKELIFKINCVGCGIEDVHWIKRNNKKKGIEVKVIYEEDLDMDFAVEIFREHLLKAVEVVNREIGTKYPKFYVNPCALKVRSKNRSIMITSKNNRLSRNLENFLKAYFERLKTEREWRLEEKHKE